MGRIRTIKPEFPQSESMGRDRFGRLKKATIPAEVRRIVARRYGAAPNTWVDCKCHYCDFIGKIGWYLWHRSKAHLGWPMFGDFELDHMLPELSGGEATPENLVLACRKCNRGKGARTPEEWRGAA